MAKAILLSGGIDSIALSYWKKPDIAITINYGQNPAESEFNASKSVCKILDITHTYIQVDCSQLGSGDLANSLSLNIAPSTEWWPYRNQLLITLASMKAVSLGVDELMVGSVISDGFHRDGTKEFYNLISSLTIYQEGSMAVTAPATSLTSVELVLKSEVPPEILLYAHSCHTNNIPCGHCRGCYKYIDVIKTLHYAGWDKS